MITNIEFLQFTEAYKKDNAQINVNTFDDYLSKYNFTDNFHNSNINKVKGDIFEYIALYYYLFKNFETYLFRNIPVHLRDTLNLGQIDKGIDLIYKCQNHWVGVQCKWRTDIKKCINKDLIAGFLAELKRTNLNYGFVFTNVNNITKYHSDNILKWFTRLTLDKIITPNMINFILKKTDVVEKIVNVPIKELRDYQKEAVQCLLQSTNANKKCIMACGTGKSIVMIEYIKQKNVNKVVVLLPSLHLVSQFYRALLANMPKSDILCICSQMDSISLTCGEEPDNKKADDILNEFKALDDTLYTTDIDEINAKLTLDKIIVLCTYQSANLLTNKTFNLGIFDEAHKTVNSKMFAFMLYDTNCKIDERLYFTATPRYYKGANETCISMDHEEIYGDTCYEYSFKKAINAGHILDFQIVAYAVPKELEDIVTEKYIKKDGLNVRAEILISAIQIVQLIKTNKECNKILTYHNTVANSIEFKKTLNYILEKLTVVANVYTMSGKTRMNTRTKIFNEFEQCNVGILCSARVLNEGVDIPCINTIAFIDSRSSTIDVTQCVGRAMRLYGDQKQCNIMIPIHYDHLEGLHSYSEIIRVLTAMTDIDDKLIEYYVTKHVNNRIIVKSMNIVDVCNEIDIKYDLSDIMEKLDLKIMKSNRLSFDYNLALLIEYCNEHECIPPKDSRYKQTNLYHWLGSIKGKINDINDELYIRLSCNEYIKANLDKYLKFIEANKDTVRLSWEESCAILFEWCNAHTRVPTKYINYKGLNVGQWLGSQKKKMINETDPLYIKLAMNEYVRASLNKYFEFRENNKDKIKMGQTELRELLFEYCDINQCVPIKGTIYKDQDISEFLHQQKRCILDEHDNLYIELAKNQHIKNNIDKCLIHRETNKDKIKLNKDEYKILLFLYCDINKCVPTLGTVFQDVNIYNWFHSQRDKINSNENQLYIELAENEYIKQSLDEYLKYKTKYLKLDEFIMLLFEYCDLNKCTPKKDTIYKTHYIGSRFYRERKKIENKKNELYMKFAKNEYVRINFDEYLDNKNQNI